MTNIEDLHPDVLACLLRRMDGPTLAAAGSSNSLLHSLSADPAIWRDLCFEAWPSLHLLPIFPALSPPAYFADSFPFPDTDTVTDTVSSSFNNAAPPSPSSNSNTSLPASVYSAVDIHYKGVPVFSRVVETNTNCKWFLGSVLRIDALDRKDPVEAVRTLPAQLQLSWAVVDAETGRAVNVSSRKAVSVDRHWYTEESIVRFVIVLSGCAVSVTATCGEENGHVREVSMTVEDGDGVAVSGREGMGILISAMKLKRRGKGEGEKDVKRKYENYLKRMRARKESKVRREGAMDLCCAGFAAFVFLAFFYLLAFR